MEKKSFVGWKHAALFRPHCCVSGCNVRKRFNDFIALVFPSLVCVNAIHLSLAKRGCEESRPEAREKSCNDAEIAV